MFLVLFSLALPTHRNNQQEMENMKDVKSSEPPESIEESEAREEPFVMPEAEARALGLVDDMSNRTAE